MAQVWSVLLLCLLFLGACDGRSYQRGYDEGYAAGHAEGRKEGYAAGHEVGYREGYRNGFSVVRPGGPELGRGEAGWVKFGATLGGLGLLIGLIYGAGIVFAADLSAEAAAAKVAAMAVAVLLALISLLIGIHRLANPLLLAGRPDSRLATGLIVLVTAVPAFVASAWLRSVTRTQWTRHQQTLIVALLAFAICLVLAVELAMLKTPEAERYLFCYFALGLLLGMAAHLSFRLTRRADGWS